MQTWDLDYETFEAFNPGIGADCDNWKLGKSSDVSLLIWDKADRFLQGHNYCVKAMHFRQSGIVKNCNKWDIANTMNCKLPTVTFLDIVSVTCSIS